MHFCSHEFALFLAIVFAAYWLLPSRWARGLLLLLGVPYFAYTTWTCLAGVTGDTFGNISVQGTGTNQAEYTMDGINTQSIRFSGPQREMFPSAESISEMKVQGA